MKKLVFLTVLFAVNSFATTINFTHWGNNSGRQSFYACDYAEAQTEAFLELVGATNIDVSCTGGITNWSMQPVSVRAKFEFPVLRGETEMAEVEGDTWNPACGLNVQIINEVLGSFRNVKVLKKNDSCAFQNSNYYYKLQIPR